MKKASIFISLTFLLLRGLGQCELTGEISEEKKSFSLTDDPVLLSLSQNAPHDQDGHLLPLPKLTMDSLHDPLQNRLALISENRKFFTIVPKASLLIGRQCHQASEMIRREMPKGTYLDLAEFLELETSNLITVQVDSKELTPSTPSESSASTLENEFPDRLILLVDRVTGLPLTHGEMTGPKAPSITPPAR